MDYQQIDDTLLRRVHDAAIRVGQSRDALLTGIPPEIAQSLPIHPSRGATLWSDLNQLNQMGALQDGSVPLVTWLKNASLLAGPRMESRVFQEALARLSTPEQRRNDPYRGQAQDDPYRGDRGAADPFMGRNRGTTGAQESNPMGDPRRVPFTPDGSGPDASDMPEVVVLHAPEDDTFAAALRTHAAVLRNTKKARLWFQSEVRAGEDRERTIGAHLARNRVVMVLFSASLVASDTLALAENALAAGKRVIPILIRACDWKSTKLGGLTVLPRNNVPIAQHSNPDQAYADIIGELRDLLERLPPETAPSATQEPTPREQPPASLLTVDAVFPPSGPPETTYVEPAEYPQLIEALDRPDRGLIVEGPSTIGKSTAVARALAAIGKPFTHLLPWESQIAALQGPDDVKGWVVVDDFHKLDDMRKKSLAQLLKWMVDRRSGERKLVLVGVGEVRRTVLALNTDLTGRFDTVRIERQANSRVNELLVKGEAALNIAFEPRSVITTLANGSFALAQQLASRATKAAKIRATQPKMTRVDVSRGALVDQMLHELRFTYSDAVSQLLRGDRATPRGVYLLILWKLSQSVDDTVVLGEALSEYGQFSDALEERGPVQLMAPLRQAPIFSECLRLDAQRLTVIDPSFAFFLRNESFHQIIRAGGLDAVAHINTDGVLEYTDSSHKGPPSVAAGSSMWEVRDADLFWTRTDVRALVKLLADAYGADVHGLLAVAGVAGIAASAVAFQARAVADVARDVVDRARQRGVVKELLEALHAEDNIAGFRPDLRRMLGLEAAARQPAH